MKLSKIYNFMGKKIRVPFNIFNASSYYENNAISLEHELNIQKLKKFFS
jgi:hypothetical protein